MLYLLRLAVRTTKADSQLSGGVRLWNALSRARQWLKKNFNFLLFLLTCYIVAGRIGPFLGKAGDLAIETFEVERLIVQEFDREALELFRGVFSKFRVVTRAPYPFLLFGRWAGKRERERGGGGLHKIWSATESGGWDYRRVVGPVFSFPLALQQTPLLCNDVLGRGRHRCYDSFFFPLPVTICHYS